MCRVKLLVCTNLLKTTHLIWQIHGGMALVRVQILIKLDDKQSWSVASSKNLTQYPAQRALASELTEMQHGYIPDIASHRLLLPTSIPSARRLYQNNIPCTQNFSMIKTIHLTCFVLHSTHSPWNGQAILENRLHHAYTQHCFLSPESVEVDICWQHVKLRLWDLVILQQLHNIFAVYKRLQCAQNGQKCKSQWETQVYTVSSFLKHKIMLSCFEFALSCN